MNDPFLNAGLSWNNSGGKNTNIKGGLSDSSKLNLSTKPAQNQVNIVQALEDDLRSEKKAEIKTDQSQELGSSGAQLPDIIDGTNNYLLNKARRYAVVDNVGSTTQSGVLGDFTRLLQMTSSQNTQNSGLAGNNLIAMAVSTQQNTSSEADRVIESQLTYDLSAASFGLHSEERQTLKNLKHDKFLDNTVF